MNDQQENLVYINGEGLTHKQLKTEFRKFSGQIGAAWDHAAKYCYGLCIYAIKHNHNSELIKFAVNELASTDHKTLTKAFINAVSDCAAISCTVTVTKVKDDQGIETVGYNTTCKKQDRKWKEIQGKISEENLERLKVKGSFRKFWGPVPKKALDPAPVASNTDNSNEDPKKSGPVKSMVEIQLDCIGETILFLKNRNETAVDAEHLEARLKEVINNFQDEMESVLKRINPLLVSRFFNNLAREQGIETADPAIVSQKTGTDG